MKETVIKINETKSKIKKKLANLYPDSSGKKERRIKSTALERETERLQ